MIRFYYGSGSSYSWRVQLALEEKGLPYEPVLLSFSAGDHRKPEHLARSPHGKVPALIDDGVTLYESSAIVEYLEDRYHAPALMPAEPAARARVRIEEIECVLYFGEAFGAVARQAFFTPPERRDAAALEAARAGVAGQLRTLETRASAQGGEFIAGKALSRADLAWLPFVEITARAGVDLDRSDIPWLLAWRERMRARPSYPRSYPPHWRERRQT
jgi:glutathione S-transferase